MAETRSLGGWRAIGLVAVLCVAVAASYVLTRVGRSLLASGASSSRSGVRSGSVVPPSGNYLIAYVMVSGSCAACRDERTKTAVRSLRDSLRSLHSAAFAKISVIGVDIDGIESGVKYLRTYGPAFDELSIGGAWMNEVMTRVVWRNAAARAEVPAIVLFQRRVDARRYPEDIMVGDDSVLLAVGGRDSIVRWVNAGTPLSYRSWARPGRK
jgi:hypothetical protein